MASGAAVTSRTHFENFLSFKRSLIALIRRSLPLSIICALLLVLSVWITYEIPYGTGLPILNFFLIFSRLFTDFIVIGGGLGSGIAAAEIGFKCFRRPQHFHSRNAAIRNVSSGLTVLTGIAVWVLMLQVLNFFEGLSYLAFYIILLIGLQFTLNYIGETKTVHQFHSFLRKKVGACEKHEASELD
jgi:hypothetical protein